MTDLNPPPRPATSLWSPESESWSRFPLVKLGRQSSSVVFPVLRRLSTRVIDAVIDGKRLAGLVCFGSERLLSALLLSLVASCSSQNSFVHAVSTWPCAGAHLRTSFGDCTKIVQCLRKKKKSYLVGVCLRERGVMLKNPIFSPYHRLGRGATLEVMSSTV